MADAHHTDFVRGSPARWPDSQLSSNAPPDGAFLRRDDKVEQLDYSAGTISPKDSFSSHSQERDGGRPYLTSMDDLKRELQAWLDQQVISSQTIGAIRRRLFVPWDSEWNAIVRDETATRETSNSQ